MARNQIDLNQLAGRFTLKIEPDESDKEEEARIARENAAHKHELWRNTGLFIAGGIAAIAVLCLCLWAAFDQSFSPEQQRFGTSIVTLEIGAIMGYLTGRATSSKSNSK